MSRVALVYVEVIRNTPLLLQLIFWYAVVLGSLPSRAGEAPATTAATSHKLTARILRAIACRTRLVTRRNSC